MSKNDKELYRVEVNRAPESGAVISQTWFNEDDVEHCSLGPSHTEFHPQTGKVRYQRWKSEGNYHRPEQEGPAIVTFCEADGTETREYYNSGRLHRMSGPAIEVLDRTSGRVVVARYFTHGQQYEPGERKRLDFSRLLPRF